MAIQINYQPAAATLGGLAEVAGSAQYMQQLYPQLVQQQQFAAQQEQQRQMAMFEAAVRERAQQQQFGQQVALQQMQGQQQIAQEALRLPARFAEIQFQNDAASQRAQQQIEAQTRNEMERMRQEFALRDQFDIRSGQRQEDLAQAKMELELEKLDRSNQFKAEYDATHQKNIAERQAMLEQMRQTGRLSQAEFNAIQAAERQKASLAANSARWQQELDLKRKAMQASLENNFQQQIGEYALSPLQASDKVFGDMLKNGYQFTPDDARKRAILAGEIGTIYSQASSNGTAGTQAVASSLRQKIAELNSIQPQAPADPTAEFEKRVISIDMGGGNFAKAIPLPNGSLQMLPPPGPLTTSDQFGGQYYFDSSAATWKPSPSKAIAGQKATGTGAAATPDQFFKLTASYQQARAALAGDLPLTREADPATWDRVQGLLKDIDDRFEAARKGTGGQPADQASTAPAATIDVSQELVYDSGALRPTPQSYAQIALANPQRYAEMVKGAASGSPWNNTNPPVTNENYATERLKPFPGQLGQPQSTIPAEAWQRGALPRIGATPEFVRQIIPAAESYAKEIQDNPSAATDEKLEWIEKTLNVINSVQISAQPAEWVQKRADLGMILREAAARLRRAQPPAQ